jgi:hypothetical protein
MSGYLCSLTDEHVFQLLQLATNEINVDIFVCTLKNNDRPQCSD